MNQDSKRAMKIVAYQYIFDNKELDKLNVVIEVTGNNFNIIRGDKTPIALIRTDAVDNIYRWNNDTLMAQYI